MSDYVQQLIDNKKLAIKQLDLDLPELVSSLEAINAELHSKYVMEDFPEGFYHSFGNLATAAYSKYNLFQSFRPGIQQLKHNIKQLFESSLKTEDKPHFICAWFNVYPQGRGAGWHLHVDPAKKTYHGVFCVRSNEPSSTIYRKPVNTEYTYNCLEHKPPHCIILGDAPCNFDSFDAEHYQEYAIDSVDNRLFIAECDGAVHSSTPNAVELPRITVAFDIAYDITQNEPPGMIWIPL